MSENKKNAQSPSDTSYKAIAAIAIQTAVADEVKSIGAREVRNRIVKQLAEEIIADRTHMLMVALELRKSAAKELEKINRPDIKTYTSSTGSDPVTEHFSEDRMKAIMDAKKKLADIDTAIEEACAEIPNFDKIKKFGSKS